MQVKTSCLMSIKVSLECADWSIKFSHFFALLSLKVVRIAKRTGFIFQVEAQSCAYAADGKKRDVKTIVS